MLHEIKYLSSTDLEDHTPVKWQKTECIAEYSEQLGWNCFDLAVSLKDYGGRSGLRKYALLHSSEQEFRILLADEIKQAAVLTAIYMNDKAERTRANNKRIIELFRIAEILKDKVDKYQLENYVNALLDQEVSVDDLPRNALLPTMHIKELQLLINNYINAHENMRAAVSKCNDSLGMLEGSRWPLEKMDIFFSSPENQHKYPEIFVEFQRVRQEIFTPYEQAFAEYCHRQDTYEQYVKEYYGGCGWFAFQRNFQDEYSTSMVDIAAKFKPGKDKVTGGSALENEALNLQQKLSDKIQECDVKFTKVNDYFIRFGNGSNPLNQNDFYRNSFFSTFGKNEDQTYSYITLQVIHP